MSQPIVQVGAFADRPFRGNPAAVCVLAGPAEAGWMQAVAAEMNLAETAFLYPEGDGFRLRWFTPVFEVDLCGHATLASAHVLWETGALPPDAPAHFQTRSGRLTCRRAGDWIEMDFPADPPAPVEPPPDLLAALGAEARSVGRGRFDYLVEVESEAAVRELRPDFGRLAAIETRGVIVTARSSGEFDFVSRFFAPASGIDEDPVTGSAHCTLAHYWQNRLGKSEFQAFQASPRGGGVGVAIEGDRVFLRGRGMLVFEGRLAAPAP